MVGVLERGVVEGRIRNGLMWGEEEGGGDVHIYEKINE